MMSDDSVWITAELAAAWLRVSKRTAHRWAKRDGWRIKGHNRTTAYLLDDVAATYERHTQEQGASLTR